METIHAEVEVRFPYAVHFTTNLFDPENPLLRDVVTADGRRTARVLFVVEGEVERHLAVTSAIEEYCRRNADAIAPVCPPMLLPGGEGVKNDPDHVIAVQRAINETGLDRHSYVAAIGGGALLDAVGYAAATAHRGSACSESRPRPCRRTTRASASRTPSTSSARRIGSARSRPPGPCSTTSGS